MWDGPYFRVLYDLNYIPIFDHAHPIITKLALAFLNLYQHAKKSVHFINSISWDKADFTVPLSKRLPPFSTTATQKEVTTNMNGTR